MFAFIALAKARTIVGEQTEVQTVSLEGDLRIEDCFFHDTPIEVSGGAAANTIEIVTTMFQNTFASYGATFKLESSANVLIQKTATLKTQSYLSNFKYGQRGACGVIWYANNANIELSSFVEGTKGSSNLEIFSNTVVDHINSSKCAADLGLRQYAFGNVDIETCKETATVKFSTFYRDSSSCGILYFKDVECAPQVISCNFLENDLTGYGLISAQECKGATKIDTCVFKDNNYHGHEIFYGYNGWFSKNPTQIEVANCYVDNTKTNKYVVAKQWIEAPTDPIKMELYATGEVEAAYTPVPPPTKEPVPEESTTPAKPTNSEQPTTTTEQPTNPVKPTTTEQPTNPSKDTPTTPEEPSKETPGKDNSDNNPSKGAAADAKGGNVSKEGSGKIDLKILIGVIGGLLVAALVVAAIFAKIYHSKNMDEEVSCFESSQSEETYPVNVTAEPTRENFDVVAPNDEAPDAEAPEIDA